MAYDWNKLKQDSIIGFSYSGMKEGAPSDLRSKVKDLVKASILLRSSPDYVKLKQEHELINNTYTKTLLPDIVGQELQDLMEEEGLYAFKFFVRYCHLNKLGLKTDLVLDLYDFIEHSQGGLKWLGLLLEDFQLEMLYKYTSEDFGFKDSLLDSKEGFEMDLFLKTTQRALWKALNGGESQVYESHCNNLIQNLSKSENKYLNFIAEVWSKQAEQPSFLIARVNEYLEMLGRSEQELEASALVVFPEVVHLGSLKNTMGASNFSEVAKVPQMLDGMIKNVYKNNDKEHALWIIRFILNERLALEHSGLFANLLFGLGQEDYKAVWSEILINDLFPGNEENLVSIFLEGWQSLPFSMVKRILTKLSPEHIYGSEKQFLNRLCYIVSRSEANEALEFLSNVNSVFLNKLQLIANSSFEQLFAKRNSFLHLLNKYGHLPKD